MSDLKLSFACGNYDRMEALRNGKVAIDGIDLDYIEIKAPREIFDRMVQNHEFDVSEMSSAEFVVMSARGVLTHSGGGRARSRRRGNALRH